jgi:hypothetical protein
MPGRRTSGSFAEELLQFDYGLCTMHPTHHERNWTVRYFGRRDAG